MSLDVFRVWMVQNGVTVDNRVALRQGEHAVAAGVGVVAKEAIGKGQVVSRIPKSAVLSWCNASCVDVIAAEGVRSGLATIVALMHEWHLGAASRWHGYLQLLPPFEPLPFFWTDEELNQLRGTEVERMVREDREQVRQDYTQIVKPLLKKHPKEFPSAVHTYEHFTRMGSLVASRAFYVDRHHGQAMLPVADLYNHNSKETVHVTGSESRCECCSRRRSSRRPGEAATETNQDDDNDNDDSDDDGDNSDQNDSDENAGGDEGPSGAGEDQLEMVLVADVAAGEEIWNTYGQHGNDVLLSKYGFAEVDNPNDRVSVDGAIVTAKCVAAVGHRVYQKRMRFWSKHADREALHWFDRSGQPPDGLLALLYTICVPDEECAAWSDLTAVEAAAADEILRVPLVAKILGACLEARLAAIAVGGTASDERSRLPQITDSKERFAAIVRLGEKDVLCACLEHLQTPLTSRPAKRRRKL